MSEEIKQNIPDSLFEKIYDNEEVSEEKEKGLDEKINVPKPTAPENKEPDVTISNVSDDYAVKMLDLIKSKNEEGYSPSFIFGSLIKISDADKYESIYEVPEENIETIDEFPIEYCLVDLYSLDGRIMDLVLSFDGPNDAYLRELNEQLNRYRLMQEKLRVGNNVKDAAAFTISIMPTELNGEGLVQLTFPIAFFRTLNDDNVSASMNILFGVDDVAFEYVKLSEDAKADIEADAIRENKNREGMFEES